MEQYTFNLSPENYQPSGCADFSKINTPKNATVTFTNVNTNVNTKEKEDIDITITEITDENGIKKIIYNIPPPSFNK